MLLIGVLLSAISGGIAAVAALLFYGSGVRHALLFYPLGGMAAALAFTALTAHKKLTGRF